MNSKERDLHETLCPRCGAEAQWSYLDPAKRQIEIACPDCGVYTVSREEFDEAAAERLEVNEPELE